MGRPSAALVRAASREPGAPQEAPGGSRCRTSGSYGGRGRKHRDVGYVPFAMGHYVESTGEQPLRFLEMFRSDHFADISLNQWMALTPRELVRAHLNLDDQTIAALSHDKPIVVR
jgi:hypothetical protein